MDSLIGQLVYHVNHKVVYEVVALCTYNDRFEVEYTPKCGPRKPEHMEYRFTSDNTWCKLLKTKKGNTCYDL